MIRVVIMKPDGKIVSPQELSTATELQQAVEQARTLIRECERLATAKTKAASPAQSGKVPYG
jgi:hypothetical protein